MVVAAGPTAAGACHGPVSNNNNNNNNNNNSNQLYGDGSKSKAVGDGGNSNGVNEKDMLRHNSDLYVRPSWTDAAITFDQLQKGKLHGQRSTIWMRAQLQGQLFQLGYFLQRHAGKVLFVAVLVLATFCLALKSVQLRTRVDQLWVQEGGRLERELKYTSKVLGQTSTSTHQLVIQTPKHEGGNILHVGALKEHLALLKSAMQVTVHLFDITWRLKDLCYAPSVPNFDAHYIEQIFDSIIPCAIITPLDCFWEGSKLLGPEYPVHIPGRQNKPPLQWTNLNPTKMLDEMKASAFNFPYKTLEEFMKRAGIGNGYQTKPCLDPLDQECPETSPNKYSQQVPDVGSELSGGCYGFAAKYMHWPEELLVGGAKHNKTGHLTRAAALQSVIQLMGERELYEFLVNTYRVHHIDWSQEKAAHVLESWQRAFSKEVRRLQNSNKLKPYNHYSFSTTSLNDILSRYSEISYVRIAIGCVVMVLYAGAALFNYADRVQSQASIGMAGVFLVCASVAAGFGFCALLGIPFNATSTQIVPFLTLGLGVHDVFLLTHTYTSMALAQIPRSDQMGVILKRSGLSVLLTGLSNMGAFFSAALIPIPALRVFSLQAGFLSLFNLVATLLVFPAMISLDLRRRRSGRADLLCCCLPESATPYYKQQFHKQASNQREKILPPVSSSLEKQTNGGSSKFSLRGLATEYYAPFLTRPTSKVLGSLLFAALMGASVWQALKVDDGFDLTDLVPQKSDEHAFLNVQSKQFGFYNMYAVTGRDFEYPTKQKMLYDYHDAFMRVKNVIKNDDGGLPDFWLSLFREWLRNLQEAFDRDYSTNCITSERWFKNASEEGILAYKLLVQTGHVDNPIDKSLIYQIRLVNSEGIINPRAFYNYLSAWASNDALAYGASQANLRPEPRQWFFSTDHELKIPKSMPLTYAQMPFFLHSLTSTAEITDLIANVRSICKKFEDKGLPNFPSGIPFLFWEQYLDLRSCLAIAILVALAASVVVVSLIIMNMWATFLLSIILVGVVVQLMGIMGLYGIKLSAVPAVLLIISIGITIHFTVHSCLSFMTTVGSRDRRVQLAVIHMFEPIIHGAVATLLGVMMLLFSEFEFIIRYFFLVLICLLGIGIVNGLFFFPLLLALIGPPSEVIPNEHSDRISTPTPPVSPILRRSQPPAPPKRHHRGESTKLHTEPSLTTITEEPNSWHSQQESCIIVQPELKVETSTCNVPNCNASDSGGSSQTSPILQKSHITTKVTATVTAKVEVHTPCNGGLEHAEKCRHHSSSSSRRSSTRYSTNVNTETSSSGSEPDLDANGKH